MLNKIKIRLGDPNFKEKVFFILFPIRNFRFLYSKHFISFDQEILKKKHLIFFKVFFLQIVFGIPVLIYSQYLHFKLSSMPKERKELKRKDVKKIGVYSPWFDKFAGGGEKVSAIIALYFEEKFPDAEINIVIDDLLGNLIKEPATLDDVYQKYGVELKKTKFKTYYHGFNQFFHINYYKNFLETTKKYDIFVNCFMNVLPSDSALSIHYVHFPMTESMSISSSLFERYRKSYHTFITNSEFTNQWTHERLRVKNTKIIYPHIDLPQMNPIPEKSKILLTVSRLSQDKKIEILIETFQNNEDLFQGYEFHIIGAENPNNKHYVDSLKSLVKSDKIKFFPNLSIQDLNQKYRDSKIYWNAMGYGISRDYPFQFEHFGLTVAEAMSYGVVPIVINYGGPAEVINKGKCGLIWSLPNELVNQTLKLIKDEELYRKLQMNAIQYSSNFSRESFYKGFDEVLNVSLKD